MGRIVLALASGAILSLSLAGLGSAQVPTQPGGGERGNGQRMMRPARERWRDLSPEDRQRFKSNAERWRQMPAEEQGELRARDLWRRERIRREAEAALQGSGLQLEAEKRELYERRYMQERRRIERALREELAEKRERELAPVVEKLKKEFAQPQGAVSPSAAETASPKK